MKLELEKKLLMLDLEMVSSYAASAAHNKAVVGFSTQQNFSEDLLKLHFSWGSSDKDLAESYAKKVEERFATLCDEVERLREENEMLKAETPTIQELRDARETHGVPV